ncbi:unnamed protein product [Caenorhabditis brenneri]
MRMKASLATMSGLKKTVVSADNSSGSSTNTFPVFGGGLINGVPHIPLDISTSQTTPVKANTSKKLVKKSSVTNLKKKKEVYTPPKSRFSKYFTTTKKGYKMTAQRLKDVFQRKDRNEPTQDTMPASAMLTPTHPTLMTETCSTDDSNCSSTTTASFQFNPTESDDIEGAKEPLPSPNVECDTSAFGFDVKIGYLAFPTESQADQTSYNSSQESTVIPEAHYSDSSSNNATSLQIGPAKENEIESARIRMKAYMAKQRSLMKTTIKVTSPNSMNQINQAKSDEVNEDVPVQASTVVPTTNECMQNLPENNGC